jgi:hypothetical protein
VLFSCVKAFGFFCGLLFLDHFLCHFFLLGSIGFLFFVGYILFRPTFYPFYFFFLVLCFGALLYLLLGLFYIFFVGLLFFIPRFNFLQGLLTGYCYSLTHTPVLATLSLTHTHRLFVFLSVLTWGCCPCSLS